MTDGRQRLKGKTAWISGAASGMGQAIAQQFVHEGASVALIDIQKEAGKATLEQLLTESGPQSIYVDCDVSNESNVRASIQKTIEAFGSLDILVNCAGIIEIGPLHKTSEQAWDRLMGINLKSMFFSFKHAYPYLRKNSRSYVVNIGSVGSFSGQADSVSYVTSKHGVLGLTRSIALDYAAQGIRCNCICPGITDTPMLRYHMSKSPNPQKTMQARLRRVPMGVAMQPRDVAKATIYLSSEESSGITGTMLVVDGGFTACPEWEHPGHTAFMSSGE